jgi:rod shape-determining protein MreD
VVAAALVRGPEQAAVLGFVAGLLLDLVPPADHVAGRWALALVVVGYVAVGCVPDTSAVEGFKPTAVAVVATVAASSFVGTSVYAITWLVLQDPVVSIGDLLPVIAGRGLLGRPDGAARDARC